MKWDAQSSQKPRHAIGLFSPVKFQNGTSHMDTHACRTYEEESTGRMIKMGAGNPSPPQLSGRAEAGAILSNNKNKKLNIPPNCGTMSGNNSGQQQSGSGQSDSSSAGGSSQSGGWSAGGSGQSGGWPAGGSGQSGGSNDQSGGSIDIEKLVEEVFMDEIKNFIDEHNKNGKK